jgi:hypothetical protein
VVTATNGAGSSTPEPSNAITIKPYRTAAPSISFAGGDNSVGIVCTCDPGTWTNSPTSYTYDWQREGVSIGAPDQDTYEPVSADAGTVGVSSDISCHVVANNAGGSSAPESSNAITIKPYRTAAPSISFAAGDNSVGVLCTSTIGTVIGATTNAFDWRRGAGSIGAADQATYTTVSADAGTAGVPSDISCQVTSSNAGGSIAASASNAITIKPYWTANPVISFAGSDNSVGILATSTTGTLLGATSTAYAWQRAGSPIGGATSSTYTPVSADAGTVGVASQISCVLTGSNAGGDTVQASNAITIKPYWSVIPSISGEPWPGGTVTGAGGTVLGATTGPTYEWDIGGVGTGDTSQASFVPSAAQYAGNLTLDATASNAGGSSGATSTALALQRVRGITRSALDTDRVQTATFTLPASGVTLIVECIGFSSDSSGTFAQAYQGAAANIRIVSVSGVLRAAIGVAGTSDPGNADLSGLPILDGSTRWFAQATYDGSELRLRYAAAGAVSSTTAASSGSGSLATASAVLFLHERVAGGGSAGSFEAKVLDRVLSDSEFLAVAQSAIGIASLDGDADIIAELMPSVGTATDGGSITTGTDTTSTGTITTESSRLTWGGL